jgi:hypothetical protein
MNTGLSSEVLNPVRLIGAVQESPKPSVLPAGKLYEFLDAGAGLEFTFPAGKLAGFNYLTADFLLHGVHLSVFLLELTEEENGATFGFSFGLLNECSARLRMPLEAVNLNRWRYDREAAFLKPICHGEIVNLEKVEKIRLTVVRKGPGPVFLAITPLSATVGQPALLGSPLLPEGVLLDDLGQSKLHEWEGKTKSADEMKQRLTRQFADAAQHSLPETFSRWGGWKEKRLEPGGYFKTYHDGHRWWLVDPDGYLFWSTGLDCVRVDTDANISGLKDALSWLPQSDERYREAFYQRGGVAYANYLAANLIRVFGPQNWYEKWSQIVTAEMRRLRFNTIANWSDWQVASRASIPYVRPLGRDQETFPCVFRDFPDVFHPDFEQFTAAFAEPLRETAQDPALIGYFLMNEPTWGFARQSPATGMLYNMPACHSRAELAAFLGKRYVDQADFQAAWEIEISLAEIAEGDAQQWLLKKGTLSVPAQRDLADFSEIMVDRYFGLLSKACRQVDPNHLNLGIRYYTTPPKWALKGMQHFDVFSMNCYRPRVPGDEMAQISALLNMPVLIGEWHFGALDVGLPASGIGHVPDQEARGKAYRIYLEDAAAKPWCVGVHYFTLYDQSALGRFDGENYNIGFLDVCNRPYPHLAEAAITSHERMYAVADGWLEPFDDEPEYLPLIFL